MENRSFRSLLLIVALIFVFISAIPAAALDVQGSSTDVIDGACRSLSADVPMVADIAIYEVTAAASVDTVYLTTYPPLVPSNVMTSKRNTLISHKLGIFMKAMGVRYSHKYLLRV